MTKKALILTAILLLTATGLATAQESSTVTGTVVSTSPDTLVVKTADGQHTFAVRSETETPEVLEVGSSVTVYFDEAPNGDPFATRITVAEVEGDSMMTEPDSEPMLEANASASLGDSSDGGELPQTASSVPLAGLAGLAALGLALAVGVVRRAV